MVAVICEFNPFHNGHKYLLETAARATGEGVLAIMSGSFTQRGEVALCSKFERARTALQNGADLVVELPAVHAVACAQRFAQGGVAIAKAFGAVRHLAFGCETDDPSQLTKAADALKSPEVNALVARQMQDGAYYPQALERAVRTVCGGKTADVLRSPNNILAVEYLRALEGSGIRPLPVKRVGVPHDSDGSSGVYMSASHLRALLRQGEEPRAFLPALPREITFPALLDRALLFRLRSMTAEELRRLPEVSEGLEHRILCAVASCGSVADVLDAVKTKRYTRARLRRILCCAALDIPEALQARQATYVRVLGFTDRGAAALKTCSFEVVTSVAKALRANGANAPFLRRDVLSTDLAALAYRSPLPCGLDFRTKIIHENHA